MASDGYIKFECRLTKAPSLDESGISSLMRWRDKLYALGLIGAYPNGIGFGNISVRIPGTDKFIITGSATGNIARLGASGYTTVTSVELDKNRLECTGPINASSESMSHAAIYASDKNTNAVVHVHNLELWNYTIDLLPTTGHDVAYGTPEMAEEIRRLFSETDVPEKRILVMGGHKEGLMSFGKDIDEAGNKMLEWFRKI